MSNLLFPELRGLKWDIAKKPRFSTKVHEATSGKESRASYWSYPRWNFTLAYEVLDERNFMNELRTLGGFFLGRKGSYDSFLYRDPSDYKVQDQTLGTGDGSRTAFQLIRSFGEFDEPMKAAQGVIDAPLTVTAGVPSATPDYAPVVYVNGVKATDYTISTSGLVTFTAAPASGVRVSAGFRYYFRCRFVLDEAEFSQFMANLWELKKLEMVSLK